MHCSSVEQGDIIERYLRPGALSEAEAEAFELHYFACGECLELLEATQAARSALAQIPARRVAMPRPNLFRWIAIAAGIFVAAVGIWFMRRRTTEPAQIARQVITAQLAPKADLTELARYDPPSYQPTALRGQDSPARAAFTAAMQSYLQADYSTAAQKLRTVTAAYPTYTPAHFFLGASELLLKHGGSSIAEMNRVLEDPDSSFHEEAQWAIAKSLLQVNDVAEARIPLNAIVSGGGDLAPQAKDLMRKLEK
jgi:transcriptional regulator with XRE-family HTH domain